MCTYIKISIFIIYGFIKENKKIGKKMEMERRNILVPAIIIIPVRVQLLSLINRKYDKKRKREKIRREKVEIRMIGGNKF